MLKIINDAVSTAIPQEELMDAAKNFLLQSGFHQDLVLADNIASPHFGSSDLLLVNPGKTQLTVARFRDTEDAEGFVIPAMAYYVWLKDLVTASELLSHGKIDIAMYLFSHNFSAAIPYLMDHVASKLDIHLVKYHILKVEGLDEPGIYFQPVTPQILGKNMSSERHEEKEEAMAREEEETSDTLDISAEELSEFNRLQERYLS
ncbi:MAG: hypothetical protein PVH78_05490 [Deltaproteobacteria bacterium]|jgi:hypothetical protein